MGANRKIPMQSGGDMLLTVREDKLIDAYIECGNMLEAGRMAGYKMTDKAARPYFSKLMKKDYISQEIKYRVEKLRTERIASGVEVMEYLSEVMRGHVKDQFGLETPVSERTRAALELAKRTVDIDNRLAGKSDNKVEIVLNWEREENE